MMPLQMTDLDQKIWQEELDPFVPQKIFDTHVHICAGDHCLSKTTDIPPELNVWAERPIRTVDRETLDRAYAQLFPGRQLHYLGFGWPLRRLNFDQVNAFTASQMADDPTSVSAMLVHPNFQPKRLPKPSKSKDFGV